MLAACLVIGIALAIFGLDDVGRRLETLTQDAIERNEWSGGRISLWNRVTEAIPDYFWFGAGQAVSRSLSNIFRRHAERLN